MVLLALLPLGLTLAVYVYARLHQYKICNFKQLFEIGAIIPYLLLQQKEKKKDQRKKILQTFRSDVLH